MDILKYFQYNSIVVLSYFFISCLALILNKITFGKSNDLLFSSYRSSMFNPLTYVRMITHAIGHSDWKHFSSNFLIILLIGPMLEEKYGSINLLIIMIATAVIIGIGNSISGDKKILGASGIAFMMILMSSFVNIEDDKIPITLVLICLFYVVDEIIDAVTLKNDGVSHIGHIIGAICGGVFGYMYYNGTLFIK